MELNNKPAQNALGSLPEVSSANLNVADQEAQAAGALVQKLAKTIGEEIKAPDHSELNSPDKAKIDLGERYTVLDKLGQGGSASVYKVQDKELGKTFAVKVMRPELLPDNQAQLRFKQEADAASCLTHPNLIAVYGSGIAGDKTPYLIMDCLSGQTLGQLLKEEGALDSARAVDILIQCCEALVHMHLKGIVHRDIKPSNIFLTKAENGTDMVKIVDFGIAKIQAYQDTTHLTQTGEVFGSPLYMSPEQCRGETLDIRSDIYSLGCVAYEVLTGVSPFAASNPIKTILQHVNGSVKPLKEAATKYEIPESLQSIVLRCLEVDPRKRYPTVDELLNQLISLRDGGQVKTVQQNVYPWLYKRLAAAILDGAILACIIFSGAYLIDRGFNSIHVLSFNNFIYKSEIGGATSSLIICICPALANIIILLVTLSLMVGPALASTIFLLMTFSPKDPNLYQFELFSGLLIAWLYFSVCESSIYQATPGKLLCGLVVVDSNGKRLSFAHATARYLSKVFILPLLSIENSIRTIPKMGESSLARRSRGWKEFLSLLPNPPRPPIDDWSRTRVVNKTAFDNPYLPNLKEHLREEPSDLNEINAKLKSTKISIFPLFFVYLFTAVIAEYRLPGTFYGQIEHPTHNAHTVLLSCLSTFGLFYFILYFVPTFVYFFRLLRRKKQLIAARSKK